MDLEGEIFMAKITDGFTTLLTLSTKVFDFMVANELLCVILAASLGGVCLGLLTQSKKFARR